MTKGEAVNWIINISADIGKAEHRELWHYEQALSEIREMLESEPERETGTWYFDKNTFLVRCSACGVGKWKGYCPTVDEAYSWMKFCPNCGTRMETEKACDGDSCPIEYK